MSRRTGIGAAVLAALMVISGCSSNPAHLVSPKITVDSPALRALKAQARIATCPTQTAVPVTHGLPDKTIPCLGGGPSVNLARLRGPAVVNLWAQFCGPCREEMPVLQKFHERYGGRVPIIGVDYTDAQPRLALELAKQTGARYPLVSDYSENIRVVGLPTTILIDGQGRIVYKQGMRITSVAQLKKLVATHLGVHL